jgi:hypothetical protein
VLMLECEDMEDARNILATLPLVEHRLIEFDIIPLRAYPGFKRLFAVEQSCFVDPDEPESNL